MIIGIVGYKGSGKDAMADYLIENFQFEKMAYAGTLKDVCGILFDLEDKYFNNRQLKEKKLDFWGLSPREILQKVGTDLFRKHFDEEFWVKLMENKIQNKLVDNPNANIVCSDVRFQNEADLIKKFGGKIIYIDRFEFINDSHEAEQCNINNIDHIIKNKGTLKEYYTMINNLIKNFFK
jgi:hypothetical protein